MFPRTGGIYFSGNISIEDDIDRVSCERFSEDQVGSHKNTNSDVGGKKRGGGRVGKYRERGVGGRKSERDWNWKKRVTVVEWEENKCREERGSE